MVNAEIIRLIKTESIANGQKLVQFYRIGPELELIATSHIRLAENQKPLTSNSTTIRAVKITIKTPAKIQVHYREILKDGKTRGLLNETKEVSSPKPNYVPQSQPVQAKQKSKPMPRAKKSAPIEYSDEPSVIDQTVEAVPITDHRY